MVATMAIAMTRKLPSWTMLSMVQRSMVDLLRHHPSLLSLTFELCSAKNIQTSLSRSNAAACSHLQSPSFRTQILKTLWSASFDTCCGCEKWIPFFKTPSDRGESRSISRVGERRRFISVQHLLWKVKMWFSVSIANKDRWCGEVSRSSSFPTNAFRMRPIWGRGDKCRSTTDRELWTIRPLAALLEPRFHKLLEWPCHWKITRRKG